MTLPASGPISMSDIAAELGISAQGLSLGDSRVRALAGKPSGPISFSDLYGKSATTLSVTLSTSSISRTSNVSEFTFPANTRTIHDGTGAETTEWTVLSEAGGDWDFPGGHTGASVTPRVTMPGVGGAATATIRCTVTNGDETAHADASYLYIDTSNPA